MNLSAVTAGNMVITDPAFTDGFKSEQAFKQAFIGYIRQKQARGAPEVFEVENEEKEPGFPDLLVVHTSGYMAGQAQFFEMKVADKSGAFHMEPTQPRFYKAHPHLDISVVVWHRGCVSIIRADDVADKALERTSLRLNVRDFRRQYDAAEVFDS